MNTADDYRHIALVFLAEAKAKKNDIHPEWRTTLVRWSRKKWHMYIRLKRKGQLGLF